MMTPSFVKGPSNAMFPRAFQNSPQERIQMQGLLPILNSTVYYKEEND